MTSSSVALTHPGWLWLLAVLAAIALAWRYLSRQEDYVGLSSTAPFAGLRIVHPLVGLLIQSAGVDTIEPGLRNIATWSALTCLTIALTQPVKVGERLPDPPRQRDVVLIVDTSVSMVLRDYLLDGQRIDRMTLLKGLLDQFVQRLNGERISLIVFGESAYTMVPLTRDQQLIRRMLARIETGMAGRFSAVGEAIALAVRQAKESPEHHPSLVLFTDASLPTGRISPEEAAALAAEQQLPLYTIAIGAGTFAAEEERVSGLIYQPADLPLLQAMAEVTGARSYQAGDSDALRRAIHDIEQREKHTEDQPHRYYREPLYPWPLLLGLLILSISQALPLLRRSTVK